VSTWPGDGDPPKTVVFPIKRPKAPKVSGFKRQMTKSFGFFKRVISWVLWVR
jgi:hypothetical protein